MRKIFASLAVFAVLFGTTLMTTLETVNTCSVPVFAAKDDEAEVEGPKVSILKKCADAAENGEDGLVCILSLVLTIMTYGVGILGVIGIIIAGVQYTTAQGDATKMAKAKNRIVQVVIGLLIYALMWAALRFLVPGFEM